MLHAPRDGIIVGMRTCCACLLVLLTVVGCAPSADARVVTLVVDGQTREIRTEALTVGGLLSEAGIKLEIEDWVKPAEPTIVTEGMIVRVTRVEKHMETESFQIPFDRRTVHDTSVNEGDTRLLQPGLTGVEELSYQVTLEDGVEVDRRLVKRVTRQEPRTEIVLVGTRADQTPISITGTVAYIADGNAWAIRRISPNQRRLTHQGDLDGRVFALSSDGSHLLFTRAPTETEARQVVNTLWMVNTTVAAAEPVRLEVDSVLWAGWEPDCDVELSSRGCRIALTTGTIAGGNPGWRANNDLWIARLRPETGELVAEQQVIGPTAGGSYGWWGTTYAWSPEGQRFAYARADEVGIVRAYDGLQTPLAQFHPYRTYAPWAWVPSVDWSPDGEFIITTLHRPSPTGEQPEDRPGFDVWVLATDGMISAELDSEAGMWSEPAFASATDYIAFGRARNPLGSHASRYDLYIMDRDGSDRQPLFPTVDQMGLQHPTMVWSPEGDRIMLVYHGDLFLVRVPHGDAVKITHNGGVSAVDWR